MRATLPRVRVAYCDDADESEDKDNGGDGDESDEGVGVDVLVRAVDGLPQVRQVVSGHAVHWPLRAREVRQELGKRFSSLVAEESSINKIE